MNEDDLLFLLGNKLYIMASISLITCHYKDIVRETVTELDACGNSNKDFIVGLKGD